jgi:Sulfotransferase domain
VWKYLFGAKRQTPSYITVVSGLPRSGTSMMMRMLEAGGMAVVVDHIRPPDADNPHGYYEFEQVKKIKEDAACLDHMYGKVVKMVSMLLYELPQDKTYKIIFMRRDLAEVLASQKIMLQRNDKSVQGDDADLRKMFDKHLGEITAWLAQQDNMAVLYMNYNEVMTQPRASAKAVNHFLGNRLKVSKMVAVVDHALYRNRAS